MKLEERKNNLKQRALDNLQLCGGEIYTAIENGYLDPVIKSIDTGITKAISKAIVKKGYLTEEEQFYDLLSHFVRYIKMTLSPIEDYWIVFAFCLDGKAPEFLTSKKYFGDGENRDYFQFEMRKLLVENMYKNIEFVYDSYSDFFKSVNIKKGMKLNSENVDLLFEFLQVLICTRPGEYHLYYLFDDHDTYGDVPTNIPEKDRNILVHGQYVVQWDFLIHSYKEKSEYAKKLLEY